MIGIGMVGCGGFGRFAMKQFVEVDGVRIAAVSSTHNRESIAMAEGHGAAYFEEVAAMLAEPAVDLVYISTPPSLHYEQTMMALNAGKHVICEKPLALNAPDADRMVACAHKRGLLLAVDLMQRYNPLYAQVAELFRQRPLGEFLHGSFVNLASDEGLPPHHWFWDRRTSGGILIEHAVHFLDMLEGWAGEGEVAGGWVSSRPGNGVEDQAGCAVYYPNGAVASFHHSFTQTARMERQEMRLIFERGEAVLHEWIPTSVAVDGIVDERSAEALQAIFPSATIETTERFEGEQQRIVSRHRPLLVDRRVRLLSRSPLEKEMLYGSMLRSMLRDQTTWIADRSHRRTVDEGNGYRSLLLALEADRRAREG